MRRDSTRPEVYPRFKTPQVLRSYDMYRPHKPINHEQRPPDALRCVRPPSPLARPHTGRRRLCLLASKSAASRSLAHGPAQPAYAFSGQPWSRPPGRVPPRPWCLAALLHRRTCEPPDPTSRALQGRTKSACCTAAAEKRRSSRLCTVVTSSLITHRTVEPAAQRSVSPTSACGDCETEKLLGCVLAGVVHY